jgi:NAD(P)-dependent dehydrogenase (short-subunit alcohol dehydrogenase family)
VSSVYRASPEQGLAWVTGASTGVGRAVAMELAGRGYRVAATARDEAQLADLAAEASCLGRHIIPYPGDVTDEETIATTVARIEVEQGPIVLAFLNAGASFTELPEHFGAAPFRQTFDLNVVGTVNCLAPLLKVMRERRRGQIAINASLAGYGGLPGPHAYGASKAALIHLAESLSFSYAAEGIAVQLVSLGFVKTPLTDRIGYGMPFLMEVGDAGRRICDGFERGGFEITMPRRLAWPMKVANHLPYRLYFPLMRWLAGRRVDNL